MVDILRCMHVCVFAHSLAYHKARALGPRCITLRVSQDLLVLLTEGVGIRVSLH